MSKKELLAKLEESLDQVSDVELAAVKRWRKFTKKFYATPDDRTEEREALFVAIRAARDVQIESSARTNEIMIQINRLFEDRPEFDAVIAALTAINKQLSEETERINRIKETVDKTIAVLKSLETLIKNLARVIGP